MTLTRRTLRNIQPVPFKTHQPILTGGKKKNQPKNLSSIHCLVKRMFQWGRTGYTSRGSHNSECFPAPNP